jgi:hypothetical protein
MVTSAVEVDVIRAEVERRAGADGQCHRPLPMTRSLTGRRIPEPPEAEPWFRMRRDPRWLDLVPGTVPIPDQLRSRPHRY